MTKDNSGMASLPLSDIIFALWKNKLKIIIMAIVGGILGVLLAFLKQTQANNHPIYNVTAAISIISENQDGMFSLKNDSPSYDDVYLAERLSDAVIYVATSNIVLDKVIVQQKLIDVEMKDLKNALKLQQFSDSQIITIRLTWDDPEEGTKIVSSLIEILPDILIQTLKIGSVEIVDLPETAIVEVSSGILYIILGFGGSAFLAIGYCLLGLLLRPTFITAQNIEDVLMLSVISEIPQDSKVRKIKKGYTITDKAYTPSSVFRESYASAAYIIRTNMEKNHSKVLYVTSALAGEGKTTVVAHLALQLSKLCNKVLLVDLDVRKPSLGRMLLSSYDSKNTLNAIYLKKTAAKDACIQVNDHLDVIPAMLEKDRVQLDEDLLQQIQSIFQYYDYVLLDASSIGVFADAMGLNQIADQVLFVIQQDRTWKEMIIDSINRIEKSGMDIIGCIFNESDMKTPGNRYYYKNTSIKEPRVRKKGY
ncbi:MAG: AAA family ATPase [Clostridium sp.]|nr:AAA family ATPase [Clostridium sp.]